MPSEHAKLSPSDSSRWISCPAAIRMDESLREQGLLVDDESSYAREGTLAHALGEIEASHAFGMIDRKAYLKAKREWTKEFNAEQYPDGTLEEMQEHVRTYLRILKEKLERFPMSKLFLEQRMDSGVEKCWGTSDAVIVSPTHIEIVDLKYGAGVSVEAEDNSQLRIYGLGALNTWGDVLGDTELIVMTVFQPRMDNVDSEEMHPDELRAWKEGVVDPAAAEALHNPDAKFGPSEKACRWCPAAGFCRARIEKSTLSDFGDILVEEEPEPPKPELMTEEEIARAFRRIPAIRAWCAALEAAALEAAYSQGKHLPGLKVVRSGGTRFITDHTAAIQLLIDKGYKAEEVAAPLKAKGIGELEKLIGKKQFTEVLGEYIDKTSGRESLVDESDKRPAITPGVEAAAEFAAVDKEEAA